MILGEGEEALSGSEALSDKHSGSVGDLLSLKRSPLDDAVGKGEREEESGFSERAPTKGRKEKGARARTDY